MKRVAWLVVDRTGYPDAMYGPAVNGGPAKTARRHALESTRWEGVAFGVCAFHGQAIIKYGTDEQVRGYVFPEPRP
jgi:hypothetical protein